MKSTSKQTRRARATEEAAEWVIRLGDSLTAGEQVEFLDWLKESPIHVAEMMRVLEVHDSLLGYPWWKELAPTRDFPSADVIPISPRVAQASDGARPRRPRTKFYLAGAACIGISLVCGALLLLAQGTRSILIRTQPGERRELTLVDGSTVTAAADTDLRIRLSSDKRLVSLARGKALFKVAKDKNRPFIVEAMQAQVVAVGTVFSVAESDNSVVVTVSEGKVAVTARRGSTTEAARISLNAHEQVVIASTGSLTPIHAIDGLVEQAWDQTQIQFENKAVAAVVDQFNAKNRIKIRIQDSVLAATPVSGVFGATDPRSFVAFLEAATGATIRQSGPDEIIVGMRQGTESAN
jgi:transmembrane sensor